MDLQLVKGNVVVPPALRDRLILVNGQVLEYGEPDQLFLNDGHGNFKSASWTGGRFVDEDGHRLKQPPPRLGSHGGFSRSQRRRRADIYVCNDYWTPDRIWINDGRGIFGQWRGWLCDARAAATNMIQPRMNTDGHG